MHSVLQGSGPAPPSCRGIKFIAFVKYILATHGSLLSVIEDGQLWIEMDERGRGGRQGRR